jgi:hypothetical protein
MYCRVLACDFDGTIAIDGQVAPEVAAVLDAARERGILRLLVTGRVLEDLQDGGVDLTRFDGIVAENGAVVWLPALGRTIQLGAPPPEAFLGELRARGIPFHAGAVVVGTSDRHAAEIVDLIRCFGVDSQLVFNRRAMMLLPSGVNKAVGVQRALDELGRSERNLVAFGDAENDLPLFAMAENAVAARGSVPAVAAIADDRLSQPGSSGVSQYVRRILEHGGIAPTPPRSSVVLGRDARDAPVVIPGSGTNVMISGDPRSGKSWLAGLVAERLLERRCRLCIVDPEGDHLSLGQRFGVMVLGHTMALPPAQVVPSVLRDSALSLVLNLSALSHDEKLRYVDVLLASLEVEREVSGMPHWIMIDEAHYFFHESAASCVRTASRSGNFLFVTYRPSLVAECVHATVGAHVITPTSIEEERYFITEVLQEYGPSERTPAELLGEIERPRAGLLLKAPGSLRWQVFSPGERLSRHAHHGRKYVDTRLSDSEAFRFVDSAQGVVASAHNVGEFYTAVQTVPMSSLRHHLKAGDFSRWAEGVLGDAHLAAGLRKLERTMLVDGGPSRNELVEHIRDRYYLDLPDGSRI